MMLAMAGRGLLPRLLLLLPLPLPLPPLLLLLMALVFLPGHLCVLTHGVTSL